MDDGSRDGTAAEARAAGARVVTLHGSQGYVAAIREGFRRAGGDIVVTIDADGELPAEAIPRLVEPIRRGDADMVQGARSRAPRPSEALITRLARLGGPVGDSGTGLRALRTDLARGLALDGRCICGVLALEVLARGGTIKEVPILLREVDKPRSRAWFHLAQTRHVLRWLPRARRERRPRGRFLGSFSCI